MAGSMILNGSQCHLGQLITRNKLLGCRLPGVCWLLCCWSLASRFVKVRPIEALAAVAPFAAGEKCPQSRGSARGHLNNFTTCQASEAQQGTNRRALLSVGVSVAAATQLSWASPANALVVSKEWEKVRQPQY